MEKDYELHNLLDSSAPDLSEAERQCFSIAIDLFGNKPFAELKNNDDHILWYDYVQLYLCVLKRKRRLQRGRDTAYRRKHLYLQKILKEIHYF